MPKKLILAVVTLSLSPASATTMRDGSGTIASAAASQLVFADSPQRIYLSCQNPIDAIEKLVVNIDGSASLSAGSYELAAGGSITFGPFENIAAAPTGAVSVTAATAGHRFICKQMVR